MKRETVRKYRQIETFSEGITTVTIEVDADTDKIISGTLKYPSGGKNYTIQLNNEWMASLYEVFREIEAHGWMPSLKEKTAAFGPTPWSGETIDNYAYTEKF